VQQLLQQQQRSLVQHRQLLLMGTVRSLLIRTLKQKQSSSRQCRSAGKEPCPLAALRQAQQAGRVQQQLVVVPLLLGRQPRGHGQQQQQQQVVVPRVVEAGATAARAARHSQAKQQPPR
jgi:hypothetical protein